MLYDNRTEIGCAVASFVVVLAYHLDLYWRAQKVTQNSTRAQMRELRRAWVLAYHGKGMVPVNTLRDIQRASFYYGNASRRCQCCMRPGGVLYALERHSPRPAP